MVTRQSHKDAPVLDAIDWDEVLTPPGDLAAATRALIPPAATLAAAELEGMAIAIRDRPQLWGPPSAGAWRPRPAPAPSCGSPCSSSTRTAAATGSSTRTSGPTSGFSAGCP